MAVNIQFGTPTLETQKNDDAVDLVVSVFFDGTFNNKFNTTARLENNEYYREGQDSYENDYSNVSRLEMAYNAQMKPAMLGHNGQVLRYAVQTLNVYIDGIGTLEHESDQTIPGGALGTGKYGVVARAEDFALKKILQKVNEFILSDDGKSAAINKIYIDAYGFSRGAAAARHFLNYATGFEFYEPDKLYVSGGKLGLYLHENGVVFKDLLLRFAGLFDTVSSYGLNHDDDNEEDELDLAVPFAVKKSLHLVAQDEHRVNFKGTRMKWATNRSDGRWVEFDMPGVHADIGGSYVDEVDEKVRLSTRRNHSTSIRRYGAEDTTTPFAKAYLNADRSWLIAQGWFPSEELEILEQRLGRNPQDKLFFLTGKRPKLSNAYSFIPLYLMQEQAEKMHPKLYNLQALRSTYKIENHPLLLEADQRIRQAFKQGKSFPHDITQVKDKQDYAFFSELRNRYLHFSANYDAPFSAMAPEGIADKRKRNYYEY